MDSIYIFNL